MEYGTEELEESQKILIFFQMNLQDLRKIQRKAIFPHISKKIEDLTTQKERRYYWMVIITKCIPEQEFEKWWSEFSVL